MDDGCASYAIARRSEPLVRAVANRTFSRISVESLKKFELMSYPHHQQELNFGHEVDLTLRNISILKFRVYLTWVNQYMDPAAKGQLDKGESHKAPIGQLGSFIRELWFVARST